MFHDGDEEVAPGLSLHLLGGHTDGMQVVRIETGNGAVVLASDSTHYYENFETGRPVSDRVRRRRDGRRLGDAATARV